MYYHVSSSKKQTSLSLASSTIYNKTYLKVVTTQLFSHAVTFDIVYCFVLVTVDSINTMPAHNEKPAIMLFLMYSCNLWSNEEMWEIRMTKDVALADFVAHYLEIIYFECTSGDGQSTICAEILQFPRRLSTIS